jgi:hypothetical protein
MLGIDAKRGIETAAERFLKASGMRVAKFEFLWNGKTAAINFKRAGNSISLTIVMPNIDDNSQVSNVTFNNSVGFILHELGHAWYTDNAPWNNAAVTHGPFLNALINGLEDPRIELAVINSGRANNAMALFNELVNNILRKDGYVKPNDFNNIPFMLAIEGRRLNGYPICFPEIVTKSPWRKPIAKALADANKCTDTYGIVDVAIELFNALANQSNQPDSPDDQPDSPDDQPDSDAPNGPNGPGKGKGTDNPSDAPSDGPMGDSDGPADGPSDESSDGPGTNPGSGKFKGRNPEPTGFIENELGKHSNSISESNPLPAIGKPSIVKFEWV